MKTIYIHIITCILTLCFTACTQNFKEYNTNPLGVTDEELERDYIKLGVYIPQMQSNIIPVDDNAYQRALSLSADIYSGYQGAIGEFNISPNNTTYRMTDDWNNVGYNQCYIKVIPAWKELNRIIGNNYPEVAAVADILKVFSISRTTDNFGPIPYKELGKLDGSIAYDGQDSIYFNMIKDLDRAIAILNNASVNDKTIAKFDFVYQGSYRKWAKFAQSLKLRLAIRMRFAAPEKAQLYAEQAVAAGVISKNEENAFLTGSGGTTFKHPVRTICYDYKDTRMGASIESYMNGYNDGRRNAFFKPVGVDNTLLPAYTPYIGQFKGVRTGINLTKNNYLPTSLLNLENLSPLQWMVAAETYFLRAEGALCGWDMGGTAQNLYETGIKTSFEQHAMGGLVSNYIKDNQSRPAKYVDPINQSYNINAGSTITIKWDDSYTKEQQLEQIITQKWIAIFPDGQEAWAEFRRTGYPKLFPVALDYSQIPSLKTLQVRRLPYPLDEYRNNRVELNKGLVLLGGDDNAATKLWWDKK